METPDDAYRFGYEIAVFARERMAKVVASVPDGAERERRLDETQDMATRAVSTKLTLMKRDGMPVHVAEAWAEGAIRGYREGMAEGERIH